MAVVLVWIGSVLCIIYRDSERKGRIEKQWLHGVVLEVNVRRVGHSTRKAAMAGRLGRSERFDFISSALGLIDVSNPNWNVL